MQGAPKSFHCPVMVHKAMTSGQSILPAGLVLSFVRTYMLTLCSCSQEWDATNYVFGTMETYSVCINRIEIICFTYKHRCCVVLTVTNRRPVLPTKLKNSWLHFRYNSCAPEVRNVMCSLTSDRSCNSSNVFDHQKKCTSVNIHHGYIFTVYK